MSAGTAPPSAAAPCLPCRRWSLAGAVVRGCALGLFLCVGREGANHLFFGNVHIVIPGAVYRCAQPSASDLERLVKTYGIRTVVNLRGFGDVQDWYRDECRGTNRLNLSLEDLPFSAGHLPSAQELQHLIEVIDRSEYPIVFHCYRGVDRTGLACTVALLLRTSVSLAKASGAMSLRFLHLPWGRTGNLDRFFDLYQEWLDKKGRTHSSDNFRHWVAHEYHGGACSCRLELIGPVRAGPLAQPLQPPTPARQTSAFSGEPPQYRIHVPYGQPFAVRVRCHNTSIRTWRLSPDTNAGVHLYGVLRNDEGFPFSEGRGGCFHAEVPPGSSIDLTVALPGVWLPGTYSLLLDMIEEQHCHFRETGSQPLEVEVEVP
jgi:hypothetical protein